MSFPATSKPEISTQGFKECRATFSLQAVVITVFFYNFVTTCDDEWEFIWRKRWSVMSCVYSMTRYLTAAIIIYVLKQVGFRVSTTGVFDDPSALVEQQVIANFPVYMVLYTGSFVLSLSMILLQVRVFALFNKSKGILWAFGILDILSLVLFIAEAIFSYNVLALRSLALTEGDAILNGKTRKYGGFVGPVHGVGNFTPVFWVPYMLVETASFALVLVKAWKVSRTSNHPFTTNTIGNILIRDNMLYYLVIFMIHLFGLCSIPSELLLSIAYEYMLFSVTLTGILATRLYINLRASSNTLMEQSSPELSTFQAGVAFRATDTLNLESGPIGRADGCGSNNE